MACCSNCTFGCRTDSGIILKQTNKQFWHKQYSGTMVLLASNIGINEKIQQSTEDFSGGSLRWRFGKPNSTTFKAQQLHFIHNNGCPDVLRMRTS